jgi:flagellin-like hook-associated protein FlgL
MDVISGYIAEIGGKVSRLNFLEDNLRVSIQNREAARSSFVDADLPEAMMSSQKYKSLSQISGHVFTQALQKDSRLASMVQNTQ